MLILISGRTELIYFIENNVADVLVVIHCRHAQEFDGEAASRAVGQNV